MLESLQSTSKAAHYCTPGDALKTEISRGETQEGGLSHTALSILKQGGNAGKGTANAPKIVQLQPRTPRAPKSDRSHLLSVLFCRSVCRYSDRPSAFWPHKF